MKKRDIMKMKELAKAKKAEEDGLKVTGPVVKEGIREVKIVEKKITDKKGIGKQWKKKKDTTKEDMKSGKDK